MSAQLWEHFIDIEDLTLNSLHTTLVFQADLSAALYGVAALLKILTLAELFERRYSIPFDKFLMMGEGWLLSR